MSGGLYSPDTIRRVVQSYMAEIRKHLDARDEFREDFFGSYRYSEFGHRSMRKKMEQGLKERQYLSAMTHEMSRMKKETEKNNQERWEVENQLNGYHFTVSKKEKEFSDKQVSRKLQKMNYFRRKIFEKRFLKKDR